MCYYIIRNYKIGLVVAGITTDEIGEYSPKYSLLSDKQMEFPTRNY
jgi:hypothetical protein